MEGCWAGATKALKVVFCVLSCAIILSCCVASKLTILFATSNLNLHVGFRKTPSYAERLYDDWNSTELYSSLSPPENLSFEGNYSKCGVPVCIEEKYRSRDVIRWMWCVLMCVGTPYILSSLQCVWKIIFKKKRTPEGRALGFVSGIARW